jgi:hypothetical protein
VSLFRLYSSYLFNLLSVIKTTIPYLAGSFCVTVHKLAGLWVQVTRQQLRNVHGEVCFHFSKTSWVLIAG